MPIDYRTQSVLLTGASSGIGAAFARTLAARGANLVLAARRADRLTSLAEDLRRATDARIDVIPTDLARPDAADELHQAVTGRGLHVTGLVNNAASGSFAPFLEAEPDRLSTEIAVGALAPVRLTAAFLPRMVHAQHGFVINLASVSAYLPAPRMAVYGATKAFSLSFTESLWTELRGTGVTVFAVCPGATATGFTSSMGPDAAVLTAVKLRGPDNVVTTALNHLESRNPGPVVIDGSANRLGVAASRNLRRRQAARTKGRVFDPRRE